MSYLVLDPQNSIEDKFKVISAVSASRQHGVQFRPRSSQDNTWFDFPCTEVTDEHVRQNFFRIPISGQEQTYQIEPVRRVVYPALADIEPKDTWLNPGRLSPEQINTAAGYRLLTKNEQIAIELGKVSQCFIGDLEFYDSGVWRMRHRGNALTGKNGLTTYRTKRKYKNPLSSKTDDWFTPTMTWIRLKRDKSTAWLVTEIVLDLTSGRPEGLLFNNVRHDVLSLIRSDKYEVSAGDDYWQPLSVFKNI